MTESADAKNLGRGAWEFGIAGLRLGFHQDDGSRRGPMQSIKRLTDSQDVTSVAMDAGHHHHHRPSPRVAQAAGLCAGRRLGRIEATVQAEDNGVDHVNEVAHATLNTKANSWSLCGARLVAEDDCD